MLSGECRVDVTPAAGCEVFLEGLRLHLDLRLVRRATHRAVGGRTETLLEVEHAKLSATRALGPAYKQAAVCAALGALALAIAVWCVGGTPAASPLAATSPTRAPRATPAAAVPDRSSAPFAAAPAARGSRARPAAGPATPATTGSEPALDRPPPNGNSSQAVHRPAATDSERSGSGKPSARRARAKSAPTSKARAETDASAPTLLPNARASRAMLELFEDPK
jgi:hypothetical protein